MLVKKRGRGTGKLSKGERGKGGGGGGGGGIKRNRGKTEGNKPGLQDIAGVVVPKN